MKCPHCDKEIPFRTCAECGGTTPLEGRFCMMCGAAFSEEKGSTSSGQSEEGFDVEARVLCPDGTCTGIIVDGKCTECGRSPGDHEV